jgi:hypothetical protein
MSIDDRAISHPRLKRDPIGRPDRENYLLRSLPETFSEDFVRQTRIGMGDLAVRPILAR